MNMCSKQVSDTAQLNEESEEFLSHELFTGKWT